MALAGPHPEGIDGPQSYAKTKLLEEELKSLQQTFCGICERAVVSMQALEKEVLVQQTEKKSLQQCPGEALGFPRPPADIRELPCKVPLEKALEKDVLVQQTEKKNLQQCPGEAPGFLRPLASIRELPCEVPEETPPNDSHKEVIPVRATKSDAPHVTFQFSLQSTSSAADDRSSIGTASASQPPLFCRYGRGSARQGRLSSKYRKMMGATASIGTASSSWKAGKWGVANAITRMMTRNSELAGGRHRAVFADVDDLKARMRMQMAQKVYDVRDLYKTSGFSQQIVRSSLFDNLTFFVIAVNAIWISIESDHNPEVVLSESPAVFQIVAYFFCMYFLVEWLLRFLSFERKSQSLSDVWFVFDTALVVLTVAETWCITLFFAVVGRSSGEDSSTNQTGSLRLLRLLRLTRMGRILHLLRAIPEIMTIIKGMTAAMRSVSFTLILLVVIIYVFAIGLTQLTKGLAVGDAYFSTVPHSMESLLMHGTFLDDIPKLWNACMTDSPLSGVVLLAYILIATVTLMNTLIGVLCKVISVVSAVEKESMTIAYTKQFLEEMWADSDVFVNEETMLSKPDVDMLINHPLCAEYLDSVEINVISFIDVVASIFCDPLATIPFPDFMDLILNLRGTNTATVKDIMDLRKFIVVELENKAEARHRTMDSKVDSLEKILYRISRTEHLDLKNKLKQPTASDEPVALS